MSETEYPVPEDLRQDYDLIVVDIEVLHHIHRNERQNNTLRILGRMRDYIERIARAEAQLKEAQAGWDSCIADLRKAAEICRETEAQLAAAQRTIAELSRPVKFSESKCAVCGKLTVYRCPWDYTPICGEIACRELHDELYKLSECASGLILHNRNRIHRKDRPNE